MKKILLLLIGLFTATTIVYAHPPRDIKITFDNKTKILHAVIFHNVSNPLNHYIREVDVALNGTDIIKKYYSRQDNNSTQTVDYVITDAINDGDRLSVEGHCSISGELKKEITVKTEE